MMLVCPKCGYNWEPRVEDPKSCPECKQRFSRIGPALKIYGDERQKITNKALANLKNGGDMKDISDYESILELSKRLSMNTNTVQQMVSRGIFPTRMVNGVVCIHKSLVPGLEKLIKDDL